MKAKKVLAMLMASAMIMGTTVTAFAAPMNIQDYINYKSVGDYNQTGQQFVTSFRSDITVAGLSKNVATKVDVYRFATLMYDVETNSYEWSIAEWAQKYVTLNDDKTAYVIDTNNSAALKTAAIDSKNIETTVTAPKGQTSVKIEDILIGGFVIVPEDEDAEYEPLFATNTYDRTLSPNGEGKPQVIDVTAYAKSEDHTITKDQTDDFQQIGETVDYTINTTFPLSQDTEGNTLSEFKITDEPTGLEINKDTVKVYVGGTNSSHEVTNNVNVTVDDMTGMLTVDFANLLTAGHDGKDVVVTYTATVIDTEYNNSVNANSNTVEYEGDRVDGTTGSIMLTKVDAEDRVSLLGAEFEVYDCGKTGTWKPDEPGEPMDLFYDEEIGAYRPALADEEAEAVTQIGTDSNGQLTIVGLDEGNYHFEEVVAPDGYSINEDGETVQVKDGDTTTVEFDFVNTKLASLPSTGGIGTTIFTIGGCAIMVTAAGLYFATRKKEQN